MKIKAMFCSFIIIVLLGCSSTITPSKQVDNAQKSLIAQEKKIEKTVGAIDKNEEAKKTQAAALAAGVSMSLNQVSNPPVQVKTAQKLNDRVISIVGAPNLDDLQKMQQIVDFMNSEVEKEKKKGSSLLADKDKQIAKLQKGSSALSEQYDKQIADLNEKMKAIAKSSDEKEAVINQMSGFFGLNAVFWGIKKFITTSLTAIVIFLVVFLILRLLSTVNPIAAAIFAVFDVIGSGVVSLIKVITPKALDMTKLVSSEKMVEIKSVLTKMVDSIQEMKIKQKDNPDKQYKLDDVLSRFKEDFDESEKNIVEEILKEQKWKK